jgi:hypothetical protein
MTVGIIRQGDPLPGGDLGLAPPRAEAFEACSHPGNRVERVDANHDGKVDLVRISTVEGAEVCRGFDSDFDGKVDTWDVVRDGRVVERARDSNGDGRVDEHWTFPLTRRPDCGIMHPDLDADGRPDPGSRPYDPCGLLAALPLGVPVGASLPVPPSPGR